jgi:hypothetical protein
MPFYWKHFKSLALSTKQFRALFKFSMTRHDCWVAGWLKKACAAAHVLVTNGELDLRGSQPYFLVFKTLQDDSTSNERDRTPIKNRSRISMNQLPGHSPTGRANCVFYDRWSIRRRFLQDKRLRPSKSSTNITHFKEKQAVAQAQCAHSALTVRKEHADSAQTRAPRFSSNAFTHARNSAAYKRFGRWTFRTFRYHCSRYGLCEKDSHTRTSFKQCGPYLAPWFKGEWSASCSN